jgi:hypothetical protein
MIVTNADIESAAKRCTGATHAMVSQHRDRGYGESKRGEFERWYAVSVSHDGKTWDLLGRRRTRQELLAMVESRATPSGSGSFPVDGRGLAQARYTKVK